LDPSSVINENAIMFSVEITQGSYYQGKIIVGFIYKNKINGKVEFVQCDTVKDMLKTDPPEGTGFLKHLANSIRKRCRDGNWHLLPTSFTFTHALTNKSIVGCTVTPGVVVNK
jgi:hypothetical protein